VTACDGAGGGGTGTRYTYAQLEGLWINAGGPSSLAPIAAAIAMAESGGCSSDINPTDNGGTQSSFGLWQISTGTHTPPAANWSNGAENAALAVAKYKGANDTFSPWGTYASGAYKAYLNNGTTPDTSGLPAGGATGGASATLTSASTANSATCLIAAPSLDLFVTSIGGGCWISKTNARAVLGGMVLAAGAVIGAAGMLILAAYGLGKSGALDKTAQAAAVIPGAAPVAAAARAGSAHVKGQQTRQRSP
jgi:hypothetical protein